MSEQAKPCPFCGKENEPPEFWFGGGGPPPMYAVWCGWCGARGPHGIGRVRDDHAGGKEAAIEEWNKAPRTPDGK